MAHAVKPYTWIVRFDVAPTWVADGFVLSDERALLMLGSELAYACRDTELAARVLSSPPPLRIAREQGYDRDCPGAGQVARQIIAGTPHAFVHRSESAEKGTVDRAISDAIDLLDSVAFVRDSGDNTAKVLAALRSARSLLRGDKAISGIAWEPTTV